MKQCKQGVCLAQCLYVCVYSQECLDIDECVDIPEVCVPNSVCINSVVSRHCAAHSPLSPPAG